MTQSPGRPQDDPWIQHQVDEMTRQIEVFEPPAGRRICSCSACTELDHEWARALARHLVVQQPENLIYPTLLNALVRLVDRDGKWCGNECEPELYCLALRQKEAKWCPRCQARAAVEMAQVLGVGPKEASG